MICPYRSESKESWIQHNKDRSKTKVQVFYTPQPCMKNLCPFYAIDDREYVDGTCIKAEKEKEQ